MNFEIIERINEQTLIASALGTKCVLKQIDIADTKMYQQLISLNNPNIVKFYDITTIDSKFYAVEEYIDGIVLKDYIERVGTLDDNSTEQITLQICNGLKAIHSLGIVHRDINPNNIMITNSGNAKIIDFGISRQIKTNQSKDTQILGTQGYASPEQFGFRQTNAKSDIYSLGVLINYMKTGALPNEMLTDGYLCEIVLRCTQIDENNRYDDIDHLVASLQKRHRLSLFLRQTPGFRKNILWHKIVATIYYIIFLLFAISGIATGKNALDSFLTFMFVLFLGGVPVPIITNYYNYCERMPFAKNKTPDQKRKLRIVLTIISVVISFVFIVTDVTL